MEIKINSVLELSEDDSRLFIELIQDAVMSSGPGVDKFAKPLSELFKRAKVTAVTYLSDDLELDCGNAQES
jgi:hypothetical protein